MRLAVLARQGDVDAIDWRSARSTTERAQLTTSAALGACATTFMISSSSPSVLTAQRGQTDPGDIDANPMMALHRFERDGKLLKEARNALAGAEVRRLNLMYQANLTAWGAAASLEPWREAGEQSFGTGVAAGQPAASLPNGERGRMRCALPRVQGLPCTYNSAFMAQFEDRGCLLALGDCLDPGGAERHRSVVTLAQAFRTHARHRGWYCYPDMLPREIIATEQESDGIDRDLSFALADLYADGDPAGEIRQEIYGSGMALAFAAGADL